MRSHNETELYKEQRVRGFVPGVPALKYMRLCQFVTLAIGRALPREFLEKEFAFPILSGHLPVKGGRGRWFVKLKGC